MGDEGKKAKENNTLPEIVLTSFEMRENSKTTTTKRHTMKKSATVTFQTITTQTLTTPTSINNDTPGKASPPSPPPGKTLNANLRQQLLNSQASDNNFTFDNSNNKVYDKSRQDSEDSSEINSQFGNGGNSTSPESIVDNVLSAASSISVFESSTISSAANEARGSEELDTFTPHTTRGHIIETLTPKRQQQIEASMSESSMNSKSNAKLPQVPSPSILKTEGVGGMSQLTSNATTPVLKWLQPNESEAANILRSPSPSPSIRIMPEKAFYPDELKCQICAEPYRDPRTLNCLHSFCFQCLINENFKQDQSIPFWSQPNEGNNIQYPTIAKSDNECKSSVQSNHSFRSLSPENTMRSSSENGSSPLKQRRGSFSFRRKKSQDRILFKPRSDERTPENSSTMPLCTLPNEMEKDSSRNIKNVNFIICQICNFSTKLPMGGLRQLPQNFILMRKVEELQLKLGDDALSKIHCSLCFEETNATYHCLSCALNLCALCKDAHQRQKTTANHKIKNIMELRRARKHQENALEEYPKTTLKCGMHPEFEIKSFCNVCLQVACADCLVLVHKGHKHEPISKAFLNYGKILKTSLEQTKTICSYAEHSIERLNALANDINRKCDSIVETVENFIQQYFKALEAHRKTLLQQILRARETKIEIVLEQQLDLGIDGVVHVNCPRKKKWISF